MQQEGYSASSVLFFIKFILFSKTQSLVRLIAASGMVFSAMLWPLNVCFANTAVNLAAPIDAAASVGVDTAATQNTANKGLVTNTSNTTASLLFDNLRRQVYQIRVIDIASGDKYTIGSGFQVSADGHIATNFHVVSPFVHEPEKYRLEFASFDDSVAAASLLAIDVIHDLAILRSVELGPDYIRLNASELSQGDRIYSMGNPQDLGMTIIEGNYNGYVQTSRYQKILFSGSLNAGMSGGPTLDANGEVIGINVSKGGEQLSFLVPVNELITLLASVTANDSIATDSKDFDRIIQQALFADQTSFYRSIIDKPINTETLGELDVPSDISDSLKCWGHTEEKEDIKYQAVHQHCQSEDQIYIKDDLYVGDFFYDFEWITTSELNRLQFYTFLQGRYEHRNLNNTYTEKQVGNYHCETDFVEATGHTWKVSSCFRGYKRYRGIYDALFLMASVDENDKAAIVKLGASGIGRDNALSLIRHFMEAVQWNR